MSGERRGKRSAAYRIGEYARRMGVTPDFLKHYGEAGIIDAEQRSGGYRWYGFHQSPVILECMRLRNYGVTVREMTPAVTELSGREAFESLDGKVEAIRRRIARDEAVLAEHEKLRAWLGRHAREPLPTAERNAPCVDWEVRDVEPLLFLPHSSGLTFLDDPDVHAILPAWVDWMPLVKSALGIEVTGGAVESGARHAGEVGRYPFRWGLIVRESAAKRHGIPLNDAVKRIPACRAFLAHFADADPADEADALGLRIRPMLERMEILGLRPKGEILGVMLMHARMKRLADDAGRPLLHERYGFFLAPLED